MNQKEDERTPIKYKIPIQSRCDVELACTGSFVDRAILEIGGITISTLKPDYENKDKKSIMELNFLGGRDLHMALITPGTAFVILQTTKDNDTPSLMFHEKPPITFQAGQDNLIEDVVIGTLAGEKKNKIIYFGGSVHLVYAE